MEKCRRALQRAKFSTRRPRGRTIVRGDLLPTSLPCYGARGTVDLPCKTLRPITALVVDDHPIVCEGIGAVLERRLDIRVIGNAATGREAVKNALLLRPHVVIMDLVMPELSGVDATEQILREAPETHIIVLSVCRTSEHIFRALRAGAQGYVLKQSATSELGVAVNDVLRGKRYLSHEVAEIVRCMSVDGELRSPMERLSAREREVLHLTVDGASSKEIARRLGLSPKSVETYRSRIMEKLGVGSYRALIQYAVEHAMTPC